jgi:pyruvate carboxylase
VLVDQPGPHGRPGERCAADVHWAGVATLAVAEGDEAAAGATVVTIEAMKMKVAITAPKAGKVSRLAINQIQQVEGGDLLVRIA